MVRSAIESKRPGTFKHTSVHLNAGVCVHRPRSDASVFVSRKLLGKFVCLPENVENLRVVQMMF
jgi:hypothetical protein